MCVVHGDFTGILLKPQNQAVFTFCNIAMLLGWQIICSEERAWNAFDPPRTLLMHLVPKNEGLIFVYREGQREGLLAVRNSSLRKEEVKAIRRPAFWLFFPFIHILASIYHFVFVLLCVGIYTEDAQWKRPCEKKSPVIARISLERDTLICAKETKVEKNPLYFFVFKSFFSSWFAIKIHMTKGQMCNNDSSVSVLSDPIVGLGFANLFSCKR